jgi:hypothetical protein
VIPGTVPMRGRYSGEMSLTGVHKAAAIETLIEHLGLPIASTMAYGDGANDLEMLTLVEIGVAMGNARPWSSPLPTTSPAPPARTGSTPASPRTGSSERRTIPGEVGRVVEGRLPPGMSIPGVAGR